MRERVRKKLVMPDLKGLVAADAQIMLSNAGFVPARERFVEAYADIGTVVEQYPLKGQLVDSDGDVEIQVAKRNYVQYLPQIYQVETSTGNSFLRNYLFIFQHLFESLSSKLDAGHSYYDPRETPADFLPWLASWVALTLDVDWPTVKKRTMIRAAARMYEYRGTRRAMEEVLEIFVGKRPRIQENAWPYAGFRVGVSSTIGEDSIVLPTIDLDHCFIVHIPVGPDELDEAMVVKVHNIIKLEKPAHSTYFLQFEREEEKATPLPFFQIGVSSLGVTDVRYDVPEPSVPEVGAASGSDGPADEAKAKKKAPAKKTATPKKKTSPRKRTRKKED